MVWSNPPAYITQLRTQLEASAAWVAAGGLTANIHYPAGGDDTAYPCAVLAEDDVRYEKFAYGIAPMPSGTLSLLLSDITGTGQLEQLARDIGNELCVDLGLANLSVESISPADEPNAAERAKAAVVTYDCEIILSFGFEV